MTVRFNIYFSQNRRNLLAINIEGKVRTDHKQHVTITYTEPLWKHLTRYRDVLKATGCGTEIEIGSLYVQLMFPRWLCYLVLVSVPRKTGKIRMASRKKSWRSFKAIVFNLSLTTRASGIQIKHKSYPVSPMPPSLYLTQESS